jgi:hypothetical protein
MLKDKNDKGKGRPHLSEIFFSREKDFVWDKHFKCQDSSEWQWVNTQFFTWSTKPTLSFSNCISPSIINCKAGGNSNSGYDFQVNHFRVYTDYY